MFFLIPFCMTLTTIVNNTLDDDTDDNVPPNAKMLTAVCVQAIL
jgi:hypothetical protein